MPSDFTSIPVGPSRAVQVCPPLGAGKMLTLYNESVTDIVYVGRQPNFPVGSPAAAKIQPLTAGVLPASSALYAICASNSFVTIIPEGGTLSPSAAQIAQQIFLSGVNVPVPSLLLAQQSLASGSTITPFSVSFPSGGAYEVTLNTTGANSQIADITIDHLDAGNNPVYTEVFTVGVGGVGNFSPVIIRGNLQTGKLQFRVTTCNLAYINALGLITGPFTIGPLLLTVYSLPFAVAETRPKMVPSNTQAGFLQGFAGVALAAGASQGPVPIPAYSGRAIGDVFSPGTLARMTIQGFAVATGATPQYTQRLIQVAAGSTAVNEVVIPQRFTTLVELNGDSVARTPGCELIAADYL